jgi:hypothetical protein
MPSTSSHRSGWPRWKTERSWAWTGSRREGHVTASSWTASSCGPGAPTTSWVSRRRSGPRRSGARSAQRRSQLIRRRRARQPIRCRVHATRQPEALPGSAERVLAVYEDRRRTYEPQPFGVFGRSDLLEDRFDVDQTFFAKHLAESIVDEAPVWTAVEVPEGHADGSSCRFFHASISGLWWSRGKTQRKRLRPGLLHQQSG